MGASTVVTHTILFIAVLGIASGLLVGIKNFSDESESTFNVKKEEFNNQIGTDISIEVVHSSNKTNTTNIYVKNTGLTKMKPSGIDVYIDGLRIPRNGSNRTIEVMADTEIVDTGTWNPKEQLWISVYLRLNENITHEVIVTTPYNTKDTETFSVSD